MAAPSYTQYEIDAMLRVRKQVDWKEWEGQHTGRPTNGEHSKKFDVFPDPDDGLAKFEIEVRYDDGMDYYSLTLRGRLGDRPWQCLCRYEIDDQDHWNPKWSNLPPIILAGTHHAHLYSERAVKEGANANWHACATVLDIPPGSPRQERDRLRWQFVNDMNIEFLGGDTFNLLFNG